MYDHETGTLWGQVIGIGIDGELTGTALTTYPATQTTWQSWLRMHPDTKVLKKPLIKSSSYAGYNADAHRLGIHGRQLIRSKLPAKEHVVGFRLNGKGYAIPLTSLKANRFVQFDADATPLIIYLDEAGEGIWLWRRDYDGKTHQFSRKWGNPKIAKSDDGRLFDLVSGSEDGGDVELAHVLTTRAFWFGWHNFYPESEVIEP